MTKKIQLLKVSSVLWMITFIYIFILKTTDVKKVGPNGSKVGLATINLFFKNLIRDNQVWYLITKYLGIIPFLIILFYAVLGFRQLIKKKSLLKVDKRLTLLGVFYIFVGAIYVFFEKVIINYRPILLDGKLEASFPSSHTLLALTICISSLLISKYYIKNEKTLDIFNISTWILLLILVIGRILSGVHWITDIFASILISSALLYLYYSFIYHEKKKNSDRG